MSPISPIVLILGAGPNIGANVAEQFAEQGYRVVLSSRKQHDGTNPSYSYVHGDLAEPKSVVDIFAQVRQNHGEPSVVVYNAGAVSYAPKENTFNIELGTFESDLNINTTSAFVAIKETLKSFASSSLTAQASKTFIYTGNAMNFASFDGLLTLGLGKSASAHMIQSAAAAFAEKGYKFYYADQRLPDGKLCGKAISGHSHGKFYVHLAEGQKQGPWLQTFVKGQGYTEFPVGTNVTFG
ncbi:putative short-chain dehydrogenases/reductase [Phaeosphaeriaceae sp. PMI808]|nr:putative short-chain dehydrogenases/reductase [Phaeosphaeriaceae sp. PMI808]